MYISSRIEIGEALVFKEYAKIEAPDDNRMTRDGMKRQVRVVVYVLRQENLRRNVCSQQCCVTWAPFLFLRFTFGMERDRSSSDKYWP